MASFPRTLKPFEVTSLEVPGPLISKTQAGKVFTRSTQQIGRTWTERFMINMRSVDGRALLATVGNYWRNGTRFTISHLDHLTPLGAGGGSPLINASAQLVINPENFGLWSIENTPVLTSGQADPFGGTAAYLIADDTAASLEDIFQVVTFTGNGTKAISIFVHQGSSGITHFSIYDNTTATHRHLVKITWTAGVPSLSTVSGAGTLYSIESIGSGWYRCYVSVDSVVAANTNRFYLYPTDTPIADIGSTYFFGANAWNSTTPSSYVGPSQPTAATGNNLYIDGATASVSNWLRAGDIVSVAGILPIYEATADVSSEANGFVRIPINPPIFVSGPPADNAAVTITGVTMTAVILEPPSFPTTSAASADWGELVIRFSESL